MLKHFKPTTNGPAKNRKKLTNIQNLGPVYTTVEKSIGQEKNGISPLWLIENVTFDQ